MTAFFALQRKEGKTGIILVPSSRRLVFQVGWPGLLASLRAMNIGLFFGVGRLAGASLRLALALKFEDLRTDSLVHYAASST